MVVGNESTVEFIEHPTIMITTLTMFNISSSRDVASRYLLRLGQGEQELATGIDFSREGQVNSMLVRRLELLSEVEKLARSLRLTEDVIKLTFIKDRFPFKEFFSNTPQSVFTGRSFEEVIRAAKRCFYHLENIFQEIEECRAFELLKSTTDRANYLMTKQTKIVAITCTYAALKRKDFLRLDFKFVRLGIPYIEMNAQGRARPSIARLYNWRYSDLGDLSYMNEAAIFRGANAGFSYDYQLVDVPDYNGRGESVPSPWFY
ncbi:hypothetical protein WN944_023414 [Citrus x changshan-huyou]|uniref:Uncharacterized protein n=1 Tax=Citrus x changshan-huyou TaxID=2935761 RepID=A0AAP0R163_9ROSI